MKVGEIWQHKEYDIKLEILSMSDKIIECEVIVCNHRCGYNKGSIANFYPDEFRSYYKKDWSYDLKQRRKH